MYASPTLLDRRSGATRIFAQIAYSLVRTVQIVPIVYTEALDLAAWFPVVWQEAQSGWRAVVLRSLTTDGSAQPLGSPRIQSSLPLALRAYPFLADRASLDELWIDDVVADEPTDIGSAILQERGNPTRGTELRLQAAQLYQEAQPGTQRITAFLQTLQAFKPWPLDFDIGGNQVKVEGLFVIDPTLFETGAMVPFAREFGVAGSRMMSAHAISLYRAATLFQRARQVASGPA